MLFITFAVDIAENKFIGIDNVKYLKCDQKDPKEIEKTTLGEIIYSEGSLPEYTTTYICDKCNTKFKVTADINYSTSIMKTQLDDYIVKHEQKITLEETDGE